jgi:hypothetical protein
MLFRDMGVIIKKNVAAANGGDSANGNRILVIRNQQQQSDGSENNNLSSNNKKRYPILQIISNRKEPLEVAIESGFARKQVAKVFRDFWVKASE